MSPPLRPQLPPWGWGFPLASCRVRLALLERQQKSTSRARGPWQHAKKPTTGRNPPPRQRAAGSRVAAGRREVHIHPNAEDACTLIPKPRGSVVSLPSRQQLLRAVGSGPPSAVHTHNSHRQLCALTTLYTNKHTHNYTQLYIHSTLYTQLTHTTHTQMYILTTTAQLKDKLHTQFSFRISTHTLLEAHNSRDRQLYTQSSVGPNSVERHRAVR